MKYEAVFGDQKRFNEQNNEMTEVMLWHDCLGPNFVSIKELSRMNLEGAIPHGSVVLAMRRIIQEPKRWTVEDQKAGRLPEVGNHLLIEGNLAEFIGLSHAPNSWCFRRLDGEWGIQTANKDWFSPIETPEEKAQREEDEFIDSLKSVEINDGTVMSFFAQGARTAYRKLKGGD